MSKPILLVLGFVLFFVPPVVLGLASSSAAHGAQAQNEQDQAPGVEGQAPEPAQARSPVVPEGGAPNVEAPVGFDNVNVPEYIRKDIEDAAREAGVGPGLLAAQLDKESHFDPYAASGVGAQGIAQFMPATWDRYGQGGDVFNPHDAIAAQGRYLKELSGMLSGIAERTSVSRDALVLAAYNAGEGAVQMYDGVPPYQETQGYVAKILADAPAYE